MTTTVRPHRSLLRAGSVGLAVLALGGIASAAAATGPATAVDSEHAVAVSGSGVHRFTTAIVHQEATPATGFVQRSTDVVELHGDLEGMLLYHVTSVIDPAAGTLTNTGEQWFSGTVLGAGPLVLHDDTFRFVVQLESGATTGEVHLRRSADAPHGPVRACDLDVTGTGMTPEGDATFDYTGTCVRTGR